MISNLNGLVVSKGTSTDEVVRTIQALISAGYKGEELLEKIDEIYGVGARNNLLKVINYEIPTTQTTIIVEYPQISPSEKTKIGDILIGSNGYIGRVTSISFDEENIVSSVTILGLTYNIIEDMLPSVTVEDDDKVLMVENGAWTKNYIKNLYDTIDITYSEIADLAESSELVPGQRYKIIDYEVILKNGLSEVSVESHPYDIIVTAKSTTELFDEAKASKKENDNYYLGNLDTWELKYTIKNRGNSSSPYNFDWANPTNGKGVVYYLKDNLGNECSYDFKQIKFKRYKIVEGPSSLIGKYSIKQQIGYNMPEPIIVDQNDYIEAFTFSCVDSNGNVTDDSNKPYLFYQSLFVTCNNKIAPFCNGSKINLNNIVFLGGFISENYSVPSRNNIFYEDCYNMTLYDRAKNNIFNEFTSAALIYTRCANNEVGKGSMSDCHDIIFLDYCTGNIVFNSDYVMLKNYCTFNVIKGVNYCVFGAECTNNEIESDCWDIYLGDHCSYNKFGHSCNKVSFVSDSSASSLVSYAKYNKVGDNCKYLSIYHTYIDEETPENNPIVNIIVLPGTLGISTQSMIEVPAGATTCTIIGTSL